MKNVPLPVEMRKKAGAVTLALATGFGLGHIPFASGSWGSLGSVGLYWILEHGLPRVSAIDGQSWPPGSRAFLLIHLAVCVFIAGVGVIVSGAAAAHFGDRDPGKVVIDEISGQQIVFIGLAPVGGAALALGFFLFRLFDVWKPFPARQSESLPGGWGIMADDWFAALYALGILWTLDRFHLWPF
jgi:phosphatidylglycerophosphatase A